MVETPPVTGPKFRSAGRRPVQIFRNFGPSAREFRPDELASPAVEQSLLVTVAPLAWYGVRYTYQGGAALKARGSILHYTVTNYSHLFPHNLSCRTHPR
jgi:hypothetical protein